MSAVHIRSRERSEPILHRSVEPAKVAHVLVRQPSPNIDLGHRTEYIGPVNPENANQQHRMYVHELTKAGAQVHVSPPNAQPDSHFVQDMAIPFGDHAIMAKPALEDRKKEIVPMLEVMRDLPNLTVVEFKAKEGATVEGGDVIVSGNDVFIGISSKRTNKEGAEALASVLRSIQPDTIVYFVPVPKGLLHLTTGMSILGEGKILHNPILELGKSIPYEKVAVPKGEGDAANFLEIGSTAIMPKGAYPRTQEILGSTYPNVATTPITEFMKVEGSITCLSVRMPVETIKSVSKQR